MPTSAKPTKRSSRSTSSRNGRANAASAKSRASNGDGISEKVGAVGDKVGSIGDTVGSIAERARSGAGTVAKTAAAATAATAAGAVVGKALISSRKRKRVLGIPMPRHHNNSMRNVAKQFAGMAGQLEKKSLDVSKASGRAKQAAKILS